MNVYSSTDNDDTIREILTEYSTYHATKMHEKWWNLFQLIVTKYHDGFIFSDLSNDYIIPSKLFYPSWWLHIVGYFPSSESLLSSNHHTSTSNYFSISSTLAISCGTMVLGGLMGFIAAKLVVRKKISILNV